jgi:hypothetical protein
MLKSKGRIAAAGTAVAVATSATAVLLLGGGSAAAGTTAVAPANSVTGTSVVNNTLTGADIKDGTLWAADLNPAVVKWFTAPGPKGATGPTGPQGKVGPAGANGKDGADGKDGAAGASAYDLAKVDGFNGTVSEWLTSLKGADGKDGAQGLPGKDGAQGPAGADGKDGATGPAGDPASDVLGKGSVVATIPATTIANIGGTYATRATDLGTFNLPAGTYLITTNATFDRIDANAAGYVTPTTDTMPQLSLRFGTDGDAGTIMGSPISRAGYTELTGSGVATVTVAANTTITVRGFGYNEDRSQFGGGQITAAAKVTATKIG